MLNPAVPAIGPKVTVVGSKVTVIGPKVATTTVVGSKVTEMLKRKLQQRLLADKAKKVRTSFSEDERDPAVTNGTNGTSGTSTTQAEHHIFVPVSSVAPLSSGSSSLTISGDCAVSYNGFVIPTGANFFRNQDVDKVKATKTKASKSKKPQKTPKCSSTASGVPPASSGGITSTANGICSPGIRKSCVDLNTLGSESLHRFNPASSQSFIGSIGASTNGIFQLSPDVYRTGFSSSCGDKKGGGGAGFSTGVFETTCLGNQVPSSCSSMINATEGIRCEQNGSVFGISSSSSSGDFLDRLTQGRSAEDDVDIQGSMIIGKDSMQEEAVDGNKGQGAIQKFRDELNFSENHTSRSEVHNNSSLIDSSLWPLIYGDNSKQLDDYIHRIYCRDCQKSQEQRPLGSTDGDEQRARNAVSGRHTEVKKCQLQLLKQVEESALCNQFHSHHRCSSKVENGEEVTQLLEQSAADVQPASSFSSSSSSSSSSSGNWSPSTPTKDRKNLTLLQAEENGGQSPNTEYVLNQNQDAAAQVAEMSGKMDQDVESVSTKPVSAGIGVSTFSDLRSSKPKKKKVPTATLR